MGSAVADDLRWLERKKLKEFTHIMLYDKVTRILLVTEIFYKLEKFPNPSFIKTSYNMWCRNNSSSLRIKKK